MPYHGHNKTMKKLRITVEDADEFFDRVESKVGRAVDDRESGDEQPYDHILSVPDVSTLARVLTETNIQLLTTIVREEPESIRATAKAVDRDVKDVHRNLSELDEIGLIEFEKEGRSKRPHVWYDSIVVDLPLSNSVESNHVFAEG